MKNFLKFVCDYIFSASGKWLIAGIILTMINLYTGSSWGKLSASIIFMGSLPYMWGIYKRKLEKPVVSSWLLWSIIGGILFWSSSDAGVSWETTLFAILIGVTNPIIILFLSIRYGEYKWGRLDTICVVVCITTIIVWKTTQSPVLGIYGGILADAIAAIPQIAKSWKDPSDEPIFPWGMFMIGSAVNLLAIKIWEVEYWLFPVYMTTFSFVILFPIILYRIVGYYKTLKDI